MRQLAQPVRSQLVIKPVVVFGEGVHQPGIYPQRGAHVAQRAAGAVADDGGGQRRAVAAVAAVDVLDDFLAPFVLKVDVDVGRLIAARLADEAFEQRVGFFRVGRGDAQAPADDRVGRRAAPLAQDAQAPRRAHDVVHGEKEHLVAAFGDQREFFFDERHDGRRNAVGVALRGAFVGQAAQRLRGCQPRQHAVARVVVLDLVQPKAAARGHGQRGGQRRGHVHLGQPRARAQVAFGIGLQGKAALRHRPADTDGGHHVLQALASAQVHVHVARGHQRQARGRGQVLQGQLVQGVVRLGVQLQQQPGHHAKKTAGARLTSAGSYKIRSIQHGEQAGPVGRPQAFAARQGGQRHGQRRQAVSALGGRAAAAGDEGAQLAPAGQIARQHHQRALLGQRGARRGGGGGVKTEFAAVDELQRRVAHAAGRAGAVQRGQRLGTDAAVAGGGCGFLQLAQRLPGAHHAGHRAFVGDGQRAVAQRPGAVHQLLRAAGAALEAEVREAVQLGVRRRGGLRAGCAGCALFARLAGRAGRIFGRGRFGRPLRRMRCGRRRRGAHRPAGGLGEQLLRLAAGLRHTGRAETSAAQRPPHRVAHGWAARGRSTATRPWRFGR